MAGYIGSKTSVAQVDGYTRTEADAGFVSDPNGAVTVDGSGNVGIGTSSPSTTIDVYNPQASGVSDIAKLRYNNAGSGGALAFANQAGTSLGKISNVANGANIDLAFSAYNSGTALTEFMRIGGSGNVGIGETDPSGYWGQANQLVIKTATNSGLTVVSSSLGNGRLVFTDNKSATSGLSDGGMIAYSHPSDAMTLQTAGTERMRIDTAGRVTMPYQPAFRAYQFIPRTGAGTIVYSQTGHNIGSHYNTATGIFTAPIAGVYHFDFSVLMKADASVSFIRVLFKVNGSTATTLGDTLTGGSAGIFTDWSYHSPSMSHSFYLNANDTVAVHNDSPHSTWDAGGYGSFSGYLIG